MMATTPTLTVEDELATEILSADTSGFKREAIERTTDRIAHRDRDISVGAFFETLRDRLGLERETRQFVYRTAFYDFDTQAGGDGMTSGPLTKRATATVTVTPGDPFARGPDGRPVHNVADTDRHLLPFITVSVTDTARRARLAAFADAYDIHVSVDSHIAYVAPGPGVLRL